MSLLHDSRPSPPPADAAPKFRPYACARHTVTRARYITSGDPRGYLPVYEYSLNGQWLMVDADNGYVLWTGIWKALGNAKADIVKMLETQPELRPQLRRIRGGYLKIQGTWINYEIALRLARRVAWTIRDDLVPIFGPTFPSTCLAPDQPGYGQLSGVAPRRKARRAPSPPPPEPAPPAPGPAYAGAYSSYSPAPQQRTAPAHVPQQYQHHPSSQRYPPYPGAASYPPSHAAAPYPTSHASSSSYPPSQHAPYPPSQHAPYPSPQHPASYPASHRPPTSQHHAYHPPSSHHPSTSQHHAYHASSSSHHAPAPPIHLPPISSLTHGAHPTDASAVLRRLRADDDDFVLPRAPSRPW